MDRVPHSLPEYPYKNDHEQDGLGLNSINTTMIESPKYVLSFVATDANVDRLQIGKVLLPHVSPLNRDAVADQ